MTMYGDSRKCLDKTKGIDIATPDGDSCNSDFERIFNFDEELNNDILERDAEDIDEDSEDCSGVGIQMQGLALSDICFVNAWFPQGVLGQGPHWRDS